jgi:DNA invertase Pin-like site-specific DNA recombinase
MLLGYARVSTLDQNTDLQLDAFRQTGVHVYWEEQRSGVKDRPELERLLTMLTPGCTVVVYKIDRLARSLTDLLRIADRIDKAGATLRSLTEPIDTTNAVGRMLFQLLCVLAEFERSIIRQRCEAGRIAAKARGTRFGVRRKLDYAVVIRMRKSGQTMKEIALCLGVSHAAISHVLRRVGQGLTPEADQHA